MGFLSEKVEEPRRHEEREKTPTGGAGTCEHWPVGRVRGRWLGPAAKAARTHFA